MKKHPVVVEGFDGTNEQCAQAVAKMRYDKQAEFFLAYMQEMHRQREGDIERGRLELAKLLLIVLFKVGELILALQKVFVFCAPYMRDEFDDEKLVDNTVLKKEKIEIVVEDEIDEVGGASRFVARRDGIVLVGVMPVDDIRAFAISLTSELAHIADREDCEVILIDRIHQKQPFDFCCSISDFKLEDKGFYDLKVRTYPFGQPLPKIRTINRKFLNWFSGKSMPRRGQRNH